ncbi:MAG TPA: 4-alpha-glucanotransferase [Pyrinomonadaceae bacterium]|nr:4-alpha-glucanotransferase [Pyrinomonadaceae bacterium]
MRFPRGSGILLHPTSLAGKFGVGDLGPSAFEFVDQLHAAAQKYWQILPLSPTGAGNSPYSAYSAFAGNTLLISPEQLVSDKLISAATIKSVSFAEGRVDFEAARIYKHEILAEAFETFRSGNTTELSEDFAAFCREHFWWLDDYALFVALKKSHDRAPWFEWSDALRSRSLDAIDQVRSQMSREIQAEQFAQFLFFRQWSAVKNYANANEINIIGDIPIFVALDSVDVWCNQKQFKLNDDGTPTVVAGVPPDYFSKTGQLWGNPIYDWQAMAADDFGWWTARVAFAMRLCNAMRLDHFIGFVRNWEVPGKDETAENGAWADVSGELLFATLKRRLGDLPIIAEDLGSVTPEVERLRDNCGFPGMRIMQYAFGGDAYNTNLPHNYRQNTVSYTGTHDNDTSAGWYTSADKNAKKHAKQYLRSNMKEPHWELIRASLSSVADVAIIPAQDLLGLDSEYRMNTPATELGNWEWRLKDDELTPNIIERLNELTKEFGR